MGSYEVGRVKEGENLYLVSLRSWLQEGVLAVMESVAVSLKGGGGAGSSQASVRISMCSWCLWASVIRLLMLISGARMAECRRRVVWARMAQGWGPGMRSGRCCERFKMYGPKPYSILNPISSPNPNR